MASTFTIRISEDLRNELELVSKKNNLKAGQIAREAIRRYLVAQRFREVRAKTIPYAEKAGFYTDEDVFKRIKPRRG
ncbi:MAG: CopG family transcriptional regulator [Candidatus Omnitrophota bacterium]